MLLNSVVFVIGLVVLYLGAEWLIKGAAGVALRYGIRPLVVGLTVVALGTSMPEFVVNMIAAFSDEDSLALGNIVGSNISNIALILGSSALVVPLAVRPDTLRKEYPIMMAVMVLFYFVALDGVISQLDGILLVSGLIAFLVFLVLDARRYTRATNPEGNPPAAKEKVGKKFVFVLLGIGFLALGAHLMVTSAVYFAEVLGIDSMIVGLTVVAIGTSLPELAASLVGAIRKEMDMSIGNVLGSNLLNVLFVVGMIAIIKPLRVDAGSLVLHFPVMLAFGFFLLPLMWTSHRITRIEGGFLVGGFLSYMAYIVLPYVL